MSPPNDAPRPRHRFARAFLLEVRPLPMAAALLIALLGAMWAGRPLWPFPAFLIFVMLAVFLGLMTAHFLDSYVDVILRGDRTPGDVPIFFRDSTGLLDEEGYLVSIIALLIASVIAVFLVVRFVGFLPSVPLFLALFLAATYATVLDRTFVGVTFGYPAGATAVLLASFQAAGGAVDGRFLWLAGSLFTALVGIKVRADVIDIDRDRVIGKRTVAAIVGGPGAAVGGYAIAVAGLAGAAAVPWLFAAPLGFALPPIGAAAAFVATTRMAPMRGSLWMSHAMLAALAAEVAVLALS